ncbi:serine protease gd-like [Leptidea sinapis]|uniref:serine protease gd-like n=1 Tax=Leptidea sinapis TaxID=189913 RepID=UPI002136F28D|nr:serine protease gd-like [Leptidea sinapis]
MIEQEMSLFYIFLVISQLLLVDGQYYVESPCPQLFEYKSDNRGSYGAIRLQLSGPVTSIVLRTNFTIAARLPSNYVGSIELIGNELSSLQNFKRGAAINYRVNFPVSSPLPRLTGLSVNDNLLCFALAERPGGQYITTISLQHTLFKRNDPNGLYDSPPPIFTNNPGPEVVENRPRPQPQPGFDITYVPNIGSDRDVIVVYEYPQPPIRQPDKINRNPPKPPPSVQTVYQAPDDYLNDRPQFNRIPAVVQENPVNDGRRPTITTQRPQTTTTEAPQTSRKPVLLSTEQPYEECGLSSENVPLIYQGNSYQRGEWPWLVAIYKRRTNSLSYICSGTLVSNQHVITAAHCMHGKATITSKRDIVVKVGVFNLEDWGDDDITVTRKLSFATVHESYNASNLANDILVMTLDRTVRFNENIKPACLWTGNPDLNQIVGKTGVVTGWGATETGPGGGGEPRMVRMPVVSTKECRSSKPEFHKLTSHNTLCAGNRTGAGPCLGDSGGGLYIKDGGRWKLRGVVSLSLISQNEEQTCNLDEYIVFTDAAQYLNWIKDAMSKKPSSD